MAEARNHGLYEVYECNPDGKKRQALIINNVKFTNLPERVGSDLDLEEIKDTLSTFKYELHVHSNLTIDGMINKLNNFKNLEDHQDADSAVVVILSHGHQDNIYGTDDNYIGVAKLKDMLNSQQCPRLNGKPKIYFIQACRVTADWIEEANPAGSGVNHASRPVPRDSVGSLGIPSRTTNSVWTGLKKVTLWQGLLQLIRWITGIDNLWNQNDQENGAQPNASDSDPPAEGASLDCSSVSHNSDQSDDYDNALREKLEKILPCNKNTVELDGPQFPLFKNQTHVDADFLIAYSTTEGFPSHRDRKKGSWFIQILCRVLKRHAKNRDMVHILDLVTKVNMEISRFQKKQISQPCSTLTKFFYFYDFQTSSRGYLVVAGTHRFEQTVMLYNIQYDRWISLPDFALSFNCLQLFTLNKKVCAIGLTQKQTKDLSHSTTSLKDYLEFMELSIQDRKWNRREITNSSGLSLPNKTCLITATVLNESIYVSIADFVSAYNTFGLMDWKPPKMSPKRVTEYDIPHFYALDSNLELKELDRPNFGIYSLANVNGKVYASKTDINDPYCQAYDPSLKNATWNEVAAMINSRIKTSLVAHEGKLYAVGGDQYREGSCERYKPDQKKWEEIMSMSQERAGCAVVSDGKRLYVIGGKDRQENWINSVEIYNTSTNSWTVCSPCPKKFTSPTATFVKNLNG